MKRPRLITDDNECKEFLMRHNALNEMRPSAGHDTAMKMWNDAQAYYMAVYFAHPGDEGYLVLIMDKDKFSFEEASSICVDLYLSPRGPGGDPANDKLVVLPSPEQSARAN